MSEFIIREVPFAQSDKGRNKIVRDEDEYVPEVRPSSKREGDSRSPNYSQLFKTPKRMASEKLESMTRFGTPVNDSFWKQPTVIPRRKAGTEQIRKEEGIHKEPMETVPLDHFKKEKKSLPDESASEGRSSVRKLENRFDKPFTKREMEQLRLEQLKGNPDIQLHLDRIAKLSREVKDDLKEYIERTESKEKGESTSSIPSKPEETSEELPSPAPYILKQEQNRRLIESARKDLTDIESDQYDQLSTEQQKEVLTRLRTKYNTPKKYNQKQLRKAIDDYIEVLEEEITELEK